MEHINIVGAGIIGLSCAWRLAQRGHAVTIFDARGAAEEASWAGAGMLAPGGEFHEASEGVEMALRSLGMYEEFVRELSAESGLEIDYRKSGAIEVALNDAEAAALSEKAALQRACGIASEDCTHEGREARFYPDDAIVSPRDVTGALRKVCELRGVTIRENEPVVEVGPDGRVLTSTGEYGGAAALVSAGAWSSEVLPTMPKVVPVRGHLVSWQLAPRTQGPILRNGSTYLLQRRSGLLIGGSTTEFVGFDRQPDERAVEDVEARAASLLPSLRDQPLVEFWTGFRPFVQGEVPVIGRVGETQIYAAYGHYRNGILLAPDTSSRIADLF